jgi:hypothetical protein
MRKKKKREREIAAVHTSSRWRYCQSCPDIPARESCPRCPVLAIVYYQSFPGSPVMCTIFCLSQQYCPACHLQPLPFCLSHSGDPFLDVLSSLYCPGCPVLAVLNRLSCSDRPALAVLTDLCWQSCSACSVLLALFRLSRSGCPILAVLF